MQGKMTHHYWHVSSCEIGVNGTQDDYVYSNAEHSKL